MARGPQGRLDRAATASIFMPSPPADSNKDAILGAIAPGRGAYRIRLAGSAGRQRVDSALFEACGFSSRSYEKPQSF